MHYYLFHCDIKCLAVKLNLRSDQNYFHSLNMQFTGIHIPLSSFFPLAAFLLVLFPREYASWSCAFSFAEWTRSERWQRETPTLTTLNFPNCLSRSQEEEGESTCMKSSFLSGGNNKLILHKSVRDPLWKAFFQLDFITSTAVMCKKPDFPSCCLQTIAFWWEQAQFPLAPILFLKQRLLLRSIKAFHWEYRHSLSYVWVF